MTDLIFAVIETAYGNDGKAPEPRKTKLGRTHKGDAKRVAREAEHGASGPATTVTVAQALEAKYGVMATFYEQYADQITGALVHSIEGALEDIYAGSPNVDPFAEAGQEIMEGFRHFLMSGEIETLGIPGVPTKAAQERKSSRFKSGKNPNERPSFVDTSLYENSFRASVE